MRLVRSLAALVLVTIVLEGSQTPPRPPVPVPGPTATLRLRVLDCASGDTLIGASISVSQHRDSLLLATYLDATDAHGVVTFTMPDFQPGDQAWVIVLPAGQSGRDSNHHYCYLCGNPTPGVWELGQSAVCNDEKTNETPETIVCRYSH